MESVFDLAWSAPWAAMVFFSLREMERKCSNHNFWRTAYCVMWAPVAWVHYRLTKKAR